MAFDRKNAAYDLSLFEAANDIKKDVKNDKKNKDKVNNVVKIPEEKLEKIRRIKISPLKLLYSIMGTAIVTGAIILIIQGQVQLTELNQQVSNTMELKAELESLNTQTEMKVEAKYSPSLVESYAVEKLDMEKADMFQKDYIRFSQGDKAEVSKPESDNVFDSVSKYIEQFWS